MQRFNTLHRFINDWIDANVDATLNRPQRADKMKSAFQRIFDAQSAAFVRCGFFDPNVAHGGPRPAGKRRSDSENVFDDAESLYSTRGVLEVRLSDDPNTAFRQIKTGYKKWIERYLQECPGEIKDDNHTKRLNKVMMNVKSAVAELNEKQGN